MPWILIATSGVFVLANLPLVYTLTRFPGSNFAFFWKFSPHQFFFSFVLVPVAVYLTCCALWWALRAISKVATAAPQPLAGIYANWPVVFLIAIGLAAVLSAAFFLSTTWSPDKLGAPYAADSAAVVSDINNQYRTAAGPAQTEALDTTKASAGSSLEASGLTLSTLPGGYSGLTSFEKAQVLLTKDGQTKFGVTDGVATALSAFQVMAVVGVAAVLLVTCIFILWLGRQVPGAGQLNEMVAARTAIFCAICCFVPYPYLFGLYRSELERVVQTPNTGGQEFVAIGFILLALGLVVFSDPNASITSVESVRIALAGALAIFSAISTRIDGTGVLRQFVGIESSIGAQFGLVLGALVLAGIAVVVTIPRP
ncbi:MAG TPA: hypothetical protein VIM37_03195 [Candidatus Microsaccharimonas sp.]|jgi:hypothetical protein